jgi:hypothetical protein
MDTVANQTRNPKAKALNPNPAIIRRTGGRELATVRILETLTLRFACQRS